MTDNLSSNQCSHTPLFMDSLRGPERLEPCLFCERDSLRQRVADLERSVEMNREGTFRQAVANSERADVPPSDALHDIAREVLDLFFRPYVHTKNCTFVNGGDCDCRTGALHKKLREIVRAPVTKLDDTFTVERCGHPLTCSCNTDETKAPRLVEKKLVLVRPETLSRTHIFDGEEVVSGDDDGQAWVATFASPIVAENFIVLACLQGKAIYAQRAAPSEKSAETNASPDPAKVDYDTWVAGTKECPACHGQGCELHECDDGRLIQGPACQRCEGAGRLPSSEEPSR